MGTLDPNIKARFTGPEELIDFVRHYDLPFPCSVHIWHGRESSVWMVAPEPGARKAISGEPVEP